MATTVKLASAIVTVLTTKYQSFLVKSDALNWQIAEAVYAAYESMADAKAQKKDKVSAILAVLDPVSKEHGASSAAIKSIGTIEAMLQAVAARPAISNLAGLGKAETKKRVSFSAANQFSGQALAAVNPKRETHERGQIASVVKEKMRDGASLTDSDARAIAKKFPLQKPRKSSPVIPSNDPSILSDTAKVTNTAGHVATCLAMDESKFDSTIEGCSLEMLDQHAKDLAAYSKRITKARKARRLSDAKLEASKV
tara:strand:- start:21990 stop:22751 length:762 start_codon:yes stop_codon:yes gene_type:complete